jgi:DHA2 family multidrug resistance protein-like MFS transporter
MIADKNPWLALAVVSVSLFLIGIDMTVLNVALPILAHDLAATTSEKLWMVNAYSLVLVGLLPGFGTLSDRIGHRKMFVAGLFVFGASSTIAAFSANPALLIAARAVLAIGAAMMLPATISIIRVVFVEDQQRVVAIGIWGSVSAGAAALGPILGGFLLEHFWWGSVFLINVPVVLLTVVITFWSIPRLPGNPQRHWDAGTSAILTVALVALIYALKSILKADIHWGEIAMATVAGLIFFRWFLLRQEALASPLIDFTLFRNARFAIGAAGALFASFVMIGLQYVLSQDLQLVRSFTPLETGLYVLPIAAGSFVAGPALGAVLFRIGVERMLTLTLALAALGMALYAFTGAHGGLLWQIVTLAIAGFGLGGIMSVSSTSIMINAPEEKAGMAGALEGIAYELGGTLGVAVMGSLIASLYTQSFDPPVEANLPTAAWDSLDQTILASGHVPAGLVQSVLDAGRAAFTAGVSLTLAGATLLTILLFALMAAYARNKRLDRR